MKAALKEFAPEATRPEAMRQFPAAQHYFPVRKPVSDGCRASAQALQLSDDQGHTLTLAHSPQRIVSLLPSLTETVCALGQCQRLVGVDRYSNYPAQVRLLPQVGGGLDPNIEAIVALRPDVVLAAASSRSAARLAALGIPVFALEPKTHADVQRVIAKLGELLQVPDAGKVWREIDAGVSAAAQSLPPAVRGTRVYFEVNRGPYGAGEASFIGQTLVRLGVGNILPASLGPFPKINPELVVRENPDLIMVGEANLEGLAQRPGWSRIRAIARAARLRFQHRAGQCAGASRPAYGRSRPHHGAVPA